MVQNPPSTLSVESSPDTVLMRVAWLLNAAAVSFIEVDDLLAEITATLPEAVCFLRSTELPDDRWQFLHSELNRFEKARTALAARLAAAGGAVRENQTLP
ncbi:hypothetical protein [Gelria sp. Kuro-4]|uniref:hypothetical protein n=1 Tax=Gelria sp. Kuro-4 TaxID=2796927 RepID=UPI001BF09642|nr:hypothetical protein [Gelria sp. Kuro-4]BCV24506.1 hypothetical protein kuro4_12790 [Gelria sp. Kuro-4]